MSLKYYYEKELSMLYEEAHRFSKQFPEQASALNLEKNKSQDPHVARLLEGCAFLTAKIHQMIHEEADHLPEQLIQRLWPQLSQGFPSCVMVQATPQKGLTQSQSLPADFKLISSQVGDENTVCEFRTSAPLIVSPLELVSVNHRLDDRERIVFEFQAIGSATLDTLNLDCLDILIDTKMSKAQSLIYFLFSKNMSISLYLDGIQVDSSHIELKLPAIDHTSCVSSQQLLFEVLCFPEKLNWLQINGLSCVQKAKALTLSFSSKSAHEHPYQFTRDDFKLFCVPAMNCFEHDAEPILLDHKHHRYSLTADHLRPESMQVISVMKVKGLSEVNQSPVHYKALHELTDLKDSYYVYEDQGYLSFNTEKLVRQTVSVRVKTCNFHYPRRYLKAGSLSHSDKTLESLVKLTNIHQPSPYLPEQTHHKKAYLLQLLRVKIEHIDSADHLKLLLTLLNRAQDPSFNQKIDSIQSMSVHKRALIQRGVFHHVHGIEIQLDETSFTSVSDRFVFGLMLHAYFCACAAMSTVIETTLVFHPSETRLNWLGDHG